MNLLQFKTKYIEEAHELLTKLDNDLLMLEKNPEERECIEQVFRIMHTLKGTSGMYGFDHISEITHDLETIFDKVRTRTVMVSAQIINITLTAVDHIRNLLDDETLSESLNIAKHGTLKAQISEALNQAGVLNQLLQTVAPKNHNEEKIRTWQILFTPSDELITRRVNVLYSIGDLLELGEYRIQSPDINEKTQYWSIFLVTNKPLTDIEDQLIFIMDYCKINLIANFDIFKAEELENRQKEIENLKPDENPNILQASLPKAGQVQHKAEKTVSTRIHVEASKLDHLMFLVSELVTTKSELLLSINGEDIERITETALKIDKISKLFRDNALDIRLISMREMLIHFKRLVRDLSLSLDKCVDFEIHGEDIELDKNIIESISEPIMHLLRNCIDHGIEIPQERLKKYKPETSILKFFAYKSGNFVFIQISDDGSGINKEKITQKAIEKGLIADNTLLSDKEIYDLIFVPGFSTAESLTQVSGRGVGMDIVRKKIQDIRGEIFIDSETGLGTSFTIKLQQSISIIDTLLIRADNTKFAIPIEDIEYCDIAFSNAISSKQNKQICYNDELIPFISLRQEFRYSTTLPEKIRVIVVNKNNRPFAIIADEIIGEYQAVVKPLGDTFSNLEFVSGASLLGDGSIALLLDTDKLKKLIVKS